MQQKEVKMAHITNKLRGLVAAFVAVFAALALVPGVASAAPIENWTDADDQKSGLYRHDYIAIVQNHHRS